MIFNDLLFESAEAQAEFAARTATLPAEQVDKLRSVLGKPSEFVGRVMSFDKAVAHWEAWNEQYGPPKKKAPKAPRPPKLGIDPELERLSKEWRDAVAQRNAAVAQWDRYVASKRLAYQEAKMKTPSITSVA